MEAIELTKRWLEKMVIGQNLCPFAKKPYQKKSIRFRVYYKNQLNDLTPFIIDEFQLLQETSISEIETTLIILPNVLADFYQFWDYIGLTEKLIHDLDLNEIFQVASFHPNYQFGGTSPDDIENYTNRSPFPTIHILREESLTKAVDNYPDTEQIPYDNIAKLQELQHDGILNIYKQIHTKAM